MRGLVLSCIICAASATADEQRFVLVSAAENVNPSKFNLKLDGPGIPGTGWKISKETLHGGKQDGCSLIHIDNGLITVTVVPTRGMSILSVSDSATGTRIFGWDSPVKEVVNPAYVDLESRGGLGWLEGFNEWMVRCGLEFAGHPGLDKFTTNTGDTAEMNLTLHGKIGNIPASEVELLVDPDNPRRVRLRGVVHERLFFGPKLQLTTELQMTLASPSVHLLDEVANLGSGPQEFQLIYHANFGQPVLEDGARVVVPAKTVTPMNETAVSGLNFYDQYGPPTAGYIEQVYLVEPAADDKGQTSVVLHNEAADLGARVAWSTKTMPYLTIWKNTVAEADGYVTGIEPATGYPFNRSVERHYGRLPKLAAGESRTFAVTFSVLDSAEAVNNAVEQVQALMPNEPTLIAEPPSTALE